MLKKFFFFFFSNIKLVPYKNRSLTYFLDSLRNDGSKKRTFSVEQIQKVLLNNLVSRFDSVLHTFFSSLLGDLLGLLVCSGFALAVGAFLLGGVLGVFVVGLGGHGGAFLGDGEGIQLGHLAGVLQRITLEASSQGTRLLRSKRRLDFLAVEQFGQIGVIEDRLWQVVIGLHSGRRRPGAVKRVQFAQSTLGPNAESTNVTTRSQRKQIQ